MTITININDSQAATTSSQATATPITVAADQSAGPSAPQAADTASTPVHVDAGAQDAGGPSAALIQEVESALGQLAETAPAAANLGGISAGAAPV